MRALARLALPLLLALSIAGCNVPAPVPLRVIRSLGTRDTGRVDRPLAVAAAERGSLALTLRADGQTELVELDASGAPTAFHRVAGLFDSSPAHEFGLLPDGRLAVRTMADRVQLFTRDVAGVYAVSSELPAGGPLAVSPDGSLYVAVGDSIRHYAATGELLATWNVPGEPVALTWNGARSCVCVLIPATGAELLRTCQRSTVYTSASYASGQLGAIDRDVVLTVVDGAAPMDGFIRISGPVAGFVPVSSVVSVIARLCQYTSEGATGAMVTVTCDYAPACSAGRQPLAVAISPDGLPSVLIREHVGAGERLALVAVGESGFGFIRGGTRPSATLRRRPARGTIADVEAAGMASTAGGLLIADGLQLWRARLYTGGLTLVEPRPAPPDAFAEPLAITVRANVPESVAVLDWLRGVVLEWSGAGSPTVTPIPAGDGEMAIDLLAGDRDSLWLGLAGSKSARVIALGTPAAYPVPDILAESLSLSAWWLEPGDRVASPPEIVGGWGERVLTNTSGIWAADAGGPACPWQYYLPESGAAIAASLRRAGLLPPATSAEPDDWAPLIRGLTRGPDGRVYLVSGRTPNYGMRVFVFAADGALAAQYQLPPEVGLPSDIAVAGDGHIWLTDPEHYRVVELAAVGR